MSEQQQGDENLLKAATSLQELLNDDAIPAEVREQLAADLRQLDAMQRKLETGALHIAIFGRVSTGKSSLLNALSGSQHFAVSPLHGATKHADVLEWHEADGVHFIDTPGINEMDGEERERIAFEVAGRSDLVLFACDGDLTEGELAALRLLAKQDRPLMLILNKADQYSKQEVSELLQHLQHRAQGLVRAENVVVASAAPSAQTVLRIDEHGNETESKRERDPDVQQLRSRMWEILQREGKTLAAMNAALFAGRLSDELNQRIAETRRQVAEKVIRTFCITKGVAVALNPVPVADLLAAASLDVVLIRSLSRVYGMPMTRREAGELIGTIVAQLALLMGAAWGVHLVSSALKGISFGLSVTITAGAQGALAYYATYLVGRATERYLVRGKSWGPHGPKAAVQDMLSQIDKKSIFSEAREDILARLKAG